MGLKDSKLSFITYEDAAKRLKEDELKKLLEAFRRNSNRNGCLNKGSFVKDVFGDMLPLAVADLLYSKLGGSSKGISFRELLCGLVLISRATVNEKIKFLFGFYSSEPHQVLNKSHMTQIINNTCDVIPTQLSCLFQQGDNVTFETFSDWMLNNSSCLSLSHWLLNESSSLPQTTSSSSSSLSSLASLSLPPSSSSSSSSLPTSLNIISDNIFMSFYQTLAGVTHLDELEVAELDRQHNALKRQSSTHFLTPPVFLSITHPPLSTHVANAMFRAFDENADSNIDLKELCCGISACCRGPQADQLKFIFKLFDSKKTGRLDIDDRLVMVKEVLGKGCSQQEITSLMESLEKKMSTDKKDDDGGLNQEDFIFWALEQPAVLNFHSLLVQVCHISLGLKPSNRLEESSLIIPWFSREESEGLVVGQEVYLVASSWWNKWVDYIQVIRDISFTPTISNPSTPLSTPPAINKNTQSNSVTLVGYHKHSKSFSSSPFVSNHSIDSARTPFSSLPKKLLKTTTLPPLHKTTYNINSPQKVAPPPPVDNSSLVISLSKTPSITEEGSLIRPGAVKGTDYEVVRWSMWKSLCQWYGQANFTLARKVIDTDRGPQIEVHPIVLRLYKHQAAPPRLPPPSLAFATTFAMGMSSFTDDSGGSKQLEKYLAYTAAVSCKQTISDLQELLAKKLRVSKEDIRLWDNTDENKMVLLEDTESTLEQLKICQNHPLLVEVRNKDLTWPEEMMQLANTQQLVNKSHTERGATGLNNLGNTCFMNSALQCLSNTHPLTQYFVQGLHFKELNRKNPLGANGRIAERYGELVSQMWSGQAKSVAPLKFKLTINKYASRFNDLQQHDSQELLAFLLDGLHEDLNRVQNKPYVELKDSDGRPDDVVAMEAWENHILRNQSIVVDLLHGQLKSSVWCCHCKHKSTKFDPFTFLSLPLPIETSFYLEITVVFSNGDTPTQHGFIFNNDDHLTQLHKQLKQLYAGDVNKNGVYHVVVTEVVGPCVKSFPPEDTKLRSLNNCCLVAYVIEDVSTSTHAASNSVEEKVVANGVEASTKLNIVPTTTCKNHDNNNNNDFCNNLNNQHLEATNFNFQHPETTNICNNSTQPTIDNIPTDSIKPALVIAYHREMALNDTYYMAFQRTKSSLFGRPIVLLLPLNPNNHTLLYRQLWRAVSRLVSPLPTKDNHAPNHAHDCDDSLKYRYPFQLRYVDQSGMRCSICPWFKFCKGCLIESATNTNNNTQTYIAIDWEATALHLRYQSCQEKACIQHPSVEENKRITSQPISLDTCLTAFTTEERLDEMYYCSKCKQHRNAHKRLQLCSLPPILIVHLKRFQYIRGSWVKCNRVVKLPKHGFDLRHFLVQLPHEANVQENCSREENCKNNSNGDNKNNNNNDDDDVNRNNNNNNNNNNNITNNNASNMNGKGDLNQNILDKLVDTTGNKKLIGDSNNNNDDNHSSSPAMTTPSSSSSSSSLSLHQSSNFLATSNSNHDILYDLYAVSNHMGFLGCGHYISYAKNPNGRWYCYNDSSCKEVSEDQVNTDTAYMLFYARRGLNIDSFLSAVKKAESNVNCNGNEAVVDDDIDKEIKKMCLIS